MRSLVERYRAIPTTETDYTELLRDTNVFGRGRDLRYDEASYRWLANRMSEVEARLDLEAAFRCIADGGAVDPATMKLTCELEDWAFFARGDLRRVLYIGSGAYPTIAIYALLRHPELHVDGVDIVPHCTVLCERVAAHLGVADRLKVSTLDALELDPADIAGYDGFFLSSAVPPKDAIIARLLEHKQPAARLYAREDEAHPLFYPLVTTSHPDLLTARGARALWAEAHGGPFPLPAGCETEPT
jgi:hypothetical protein